MLRHAMPYFNGSCPSVVPAAERSADTSDGAKENRAGLYFVATAKEPLQITEALRRMCGHYAQAMDGGIGTIDNLFGITTAISGAYYYVPSLAELTSLSDNKSTIPERSAIDSSSPLSLFDFASASTVVMSLPPELRGIRAVDDSKYFKARAPKRFVCYELCSNCESEQSCVHEEGSNIKLCHLCRMVTFVH